jgi:hypothetical protein
LNKLTPDFTSAQSVEGRNVPVYTNPGKYSRFVLRLRLNIHKILNKFYGTVERELQLWPKGIYLSNNEVVCGSLWFEAVIQFAVLKVLKSGG